MFEKRRHDILTSRQRAVLDDNTSLAIQAGVMQRYQTAMCELYQEFRAGHYGNESLLDAATIRLGKLTGLVLHDFHEMSRAIGAEAPYAFGVESRTNVVPGDCASISVIKVDTITGSEIPDSRLSLGIVTNDGLLYPGEHNFTEADLALAIDRVRIQEQNGLSYVLFDQEPAVRWLTAAS